MFSRLFHGLAKVFIGSDVVAVEGGTRSVAADCHRNTFTDAGPDHVADPGAPKVVKETRWQLHSLFFAVYRDGYRLAVLVEQRPNEMTAAEDFRGLLQIDEHAILTRSSRSFNALHGGIG